MSSPRIQTLPIQLANQIAAGEVVERPASVVKELIENSIDAGASQISMTIEGAGSQLIRINDNGHGIHPEDLPLALSRHATSKLLSSQQLSEIATLGFRGEALPSIASVAQFSITSRQANNESAWQINATQDNPEPASHAKGTTIEVRDLFFNLPARRRFLRSNKTEQNHILTTLYRLALSRFDVGFHCQIGTSTKIKLPAAVDRPQQQQRIRKICGAAFLEKSRYIEQHYDDIHLSGWLGLPDAHRPQTDVQYFFINGRVIRDRVINHAIRSAFGEAIPAGRHPAFVLYLVLPLEKVDVNVHPTKHEVRFRDARLIHGLITAAVQDGLAHATNTETNKIHKQAELITSVEEPAVDYNKLTISKVTASHPVTKTKLKPISLIKQRYLITEHEGESLLLDLQRAEQTLKQEQLCSAVENNTLSTRPLLVPINITVSPQQVQLLSAAMKYLQGFGFSYITSETQIRLSQIPSLLAQVELPLLVAQLSSLLANSTTLTITEIASLIPLSPITSVEQAEHILNQLDMDEKKASWYCTLDQQRLTSLFST
jgi:DNA mismatch repair protein MutL